MFELWNWLVETFYSLFIFIRASKKAAISKDGNDILAAVKQAYFLLIW
jgi:hypothetical protein